MAETATTDAERSSKLRKAYGAATQQLREAHRDEFERLYVAAAKAEGVEYKPKPKPEDAARAQAEALFAQFPNLREQMLSEDTESSAGDEPVAPERD